MKTPKKTIGKVTVRMVDSMIHQIYKVHSNIDNERV